MAKPNAKAAFRTKAPGIKAQLIRDFPITPTDAAAMSDSLVDRPRCFHLLDTGEALLLGNAVLLPTRIKLDQPHGKPDRATRFLEGMGHVTARRRSPRGPG